MFYNHFENAIVSEEKTLSAKWRRSRKYSKRFNVFKAIRKIENAKPSQAFINKTLRAKRYSRPYVYLNPKGCKERKWREPKPLVDVFEEEEEVIVVAEFVGFSKENLQIHVKNQRLTLSAENLDRKYHKSLNLPVEVIPSSIRTKYKNGVLEIRLKKLLKEKALDKIAG